jgi:16S rRNA G1207 methylase RsmC
VSHYFTNDDSTPIERRRVRATIWGRDLDFTTAGGMFSADGLDLGTSVLLRTYPPPTTAGRVLDLGCGWGPIAVGIALTCPATVVDAVDVNDRALTVCAENAAAYGVADRVRTFRPEHTFGPQQALGPEPGLVPEHSGPTATYDEIWSNPPIRIGKDALHDLLLSWLPRLAEAGVAKLVVGRNLGADTLQRWLRDQGWACERAASAKGFRVLEVAR